MFKQLNEIEKKTVSKQLKCCQKVLIRNVFPVDLNRQNLEQICHYKNRIRL